MIEFGEWLPDQGVLNNPGATVAKNVYPTLNTYLPFNSLSTFTSAAADRIRGGIYVKDNVEDVYGYVGTDDELYQIGMTLTDVSRLSGGGYTTTIENNWGFTQFGNQVIATNFDDDPQVITLGGANFAALSGAPPRAKHVATVGNFIVFGNTFDATDGHRANRVWWSAFEDITGWTPGTDQSDRQDFAAGGSVQKVIGGEYGIIFQDRAIRRMDYVGTPIIFQINEVEPERGTSIPGSVAQYGRKTFYRASDGFYELVDGSYSNSIGAEKADRYFDEDFDSSFKNRVSSAVDPVRNLVFWAYPGVGNTNGVPNRIIIYNWITKRWAFVDVEVEFIFNGFTSGFTLEQLDTFGTLDTLQYSLDSSAWKGGNVLLAGASTSDQIGFFNGSPLDSVIETSEFGGQNITKLRGIRSYVEGDQNTAITVQVGYRPTLRVNPTWTTAASLNANGIADILKSARYMRARLKISGGFSHAKGIDPIRSQGGKW